MGETPAQGRLLSILGLGFGLAGVVGGSIGAGILRTPGLVAAQLPSAPWVLAAWLAGGLYALLGAVCVSELATSLPRSGGWYVYAERAFGVRAGFLVGWTDWLAHCIGLAWVATTAGEYGRTLLPQALADRPFAAEALALLMLAVFSLVQLRGLRAGRASQELLSLLKAGVLLVLVAACFLLPAHQPLAAAEPLLPAAGNAAGAPGLVLASVLALQAVITTYDGWVSPVYFAEEFSQPDHDLPRSLIGGVLVVLVLYLLINGALLRVLPIEVLARSPLPAADAASLLVGPAGGLVITLVALVATLGLINTVVMAAPRILYGLGRDRLLPAFTTAVNAGGTPTAALGLTAATSAALVLAGSFDRLLTMGSILYVSLPLSGIGALLMLRHREPELSRPFPAWGYPLTPLLVAAVSLAFLVGTAASAPLSMLAATGLVALGLLPALQRFPGADLPHRSAD
jgi:APA family basic amino acid/polyamine antiporter